MIVGHASLLAADAGTAAEAERARATAGRTATKAPQPRSRPPVGVTLPRGLEFGIYPGGAAGSVASRGEPVAESADRRAAAIEALRPDGGRTFTVRLYDAFTSSGDAAKVPSRLREQIADHTARGLRVELVLRYRPSDPDGDVAGFERFVRSRVRELAGDRLVTDLQVANEANVPGAPDAADGAYPGAVTALARGLVAADREARTRGVPQLRTGFNWAYGEAPEEARFFAALARIGGDDLRAAVDWVGLTAYPGTWGPPLAPGPLAKGARRAMVRALDVLRNTHMRRAGLARSAIVVTETGYPTDRAERTEADQRTALTAIVGAVAEHRRTYGVRGLRWFALRDADSSVPGFESHYGLMRDDYSPKPAFSRYRELIHRHG